MNKGTSFITLATLLLMLLDSVAFADASADPNAATTPTESVEATGSNEAPTNESPECQPNEKYIEFIRNSDDLMEIDRALKALLNTKTDSYCKWVEQANQNFIDEKYQDINQFEFDRRCVASKQLINNYITAINTHLKEECVNNTCDAAFEKLAKIPFLFEMDGSFSYKEPVSNYRVETLSSALNISTHRFSRKILDGTCGEAEISFLFTGAYPTDQRSRLNELIDANLDSMFKQMKYEEITPTEVFDNLFNDSYYTYIYDEKLEWVTSRYLSYSQNYYSYTGGAHGSSTVQYQNIDLSSFKIITLEDLFKPSMHAEVLNLFKDAFFAANKLDPSKSYDELGFWFNPSNIPKEYQEWSLPDGFYLPANFLLNSRGITFIYQQYEIAPYAAGMPTIEITWDKIKPLLEDDFLIS